MRPPQTQTGNLTVSLLVQSCLPDFSLVTRDLSWQHIKQVVTVRILNSRYPNLGRSTTKAVYHSTNVSELSPFLSTTVYATQLQDRLQLAALHCNAFSWYVVPSSFTETHYSFPQLHGRRREPPAAISVRLPYPSTLINSVLLLTICS